MMVDVHLTDGRTVFRFLSRGQMINLIKRDPETLDEQKAVRTWVRWHPQDELEPCRIQYVRRHQIAFVRQVEPEEHAAFLQAGGAQEAAAA